jgi:hypothetical protein
MNKHVQALTVSLAVLLVLGTCTVPVWAQNHYKSFNVSTYVIQGTVQVLFLRTGEFSRGYAQDLSKITHA